MPLLWGARISTVIRGTAGRNRGAAADRQLAVAGSYTATGRAAAVPAARSPDVPGVSAMPGRTAARRAECDVHRRVHPHVWRQYQRRSGQALPPSATIWWAGNRSPHNQHDLTRAGSPPSGAGCCELVMTRSPRSPAARAVVSAFDDAAPTAAPVRSASRPSDASPLLIHTLPVHLGERRAAAVTPAP